jgi:hypothetical protein
VVEYMQAIPSESFCFPGSSPLKVINIAVFSRRPGTVVDSTVHAMPAAISSNPNPLLEFMKSRIARLSRS